MTICIFGDSITWGANDNAHGGWANMLRNNFAPDDIDVYNCGVSGDNTDDLLERFEVEAKAREADIIVFAIGINDSQYTGNRDNSRVPKDKFIANLEQLLTRARSITDKVLFVGLIHVAESKVMPIPWSDSNKNYGNTNIDLYNSLIEEFSRKNNIPFLNILDLLDLSDLDDGLHPNAKGHEKMFETIKKFITSNI